MIKIKDKLLEPYEIWQEENQFSVGIPKVDKKDNEYLYQPSYFTKFESVILHVTKLKMLETESTYTLRKYLDLYDIIKQELINNIKIDN